MDLEDWELLPKNLYKGLDLDHDEDHEAAMRIVRNTDKSFDMDYYICPTQDPVGKTEFHRRPSLVPTQLLQVPINWEPVYTVEDTDCKKNQDSNVADPDPEQSRESVPSPRITFKTAKENEFVDMKIDLPARFTSPLPQREDKHSHSGRVLAGEYYGEMGKEVEEGGDVRSKKEADWDEEKNIRGEKMNLWKMSLHGIGAICSFGVATAAATFCVFFLGRNSSIRGCRNKNQPLRFQIYTDDNKYHPDVNKNPKAGELFKSIRCSYEVLSNEATRTRYDRELKLQENYRVIRHYYYNTTDREVEDAMKYCYNWSEKKRYSSPYPNSHFYTETANEPQEKEETAQQEQRNSFANVLKSLFISMFLLYTLGYLASLTVSTFSALLDEELDMGYKSGFMIAWILGGKGGILLTLCLTFASWLCGKASSSVVILGVVAMWVGSNLATHAPLPQGALLTLLYMSIKLQVDSR